MKTGVAQTDITPTATVDLSGYAGRVQPSTGVQDPLWARCLFLEEGGQRLLWIHADLIGFDREFVTAFRQWAQKELRLKPSQVLLSATHTHTGPATLRVTGCGNYEVKYAEFLDGCFRELARTALRKTEECSVVAAEAQFEFSIDRRKKPSAHTDPRLAILGWRRADGTYAAAVTNYAMHAVMMGRIRLVSADYPGQMAQALTRQLPGTPVILATNGGCGNIDPPNCGVLADKVREIGEELARRAAAALTQARPVPSANLGVAARVIALPLDVPSIPEINQRAEKDLNGIKGDSPWNLHHREAIQTWQKTMTDRVSRGMPPCADAELFVVVIGPVVLTAVNAEIFSRFAEKIRQRTGRTAYVIGYANGVLGYVPTAEAYDEGGYEVDSSNFFYNTCRPQRGGLEFLVDQTALLIQEMEEKR